MANNLIAFIAVIAAAAYVTHSIYVALLGPLSHLPGPVLARFSNLWRLRNAASGRAPRNLQALHEHYGPVVRIGPAHISVADPAYIPLIYGISSKFTKSDFYNMFVPTVGNKSYDSIFSVQHQERHRKLKSGVAQKYSLSSLLSLEPLVDKVTQSFMSKLREISQPHDGAEIPVIDLGAYLQYYAFDVIGSITFSKTFGFIEAGSDHNKVIENLEAGLKYGATVGQVPFFHPYLLGSTTVQSIIARIPALANSNPIPIVHTMITESIESQANLTKESGHEDFLTFLKSQNTKDDERMNQDTMINHMFVNLLAGSDTTAISLRTIFYHLMQNPRSYARLQAEIDAADNAGLLSPTVSHAESQAHLPYLTHVIKEGLRIHPAVALTLERVVPHGGARIQEHLIPENSIVGISAWVVHYDKSVFGEDVEKFRPERWESGNVEGEEERLRKMEKSFFPFGHGARSCIGKNISLLEMGKFVPQLLREFSLEWAGNGDWNVDSSWFAKQSGILVRCRSRRMRD